jgi:hypothetical protein
VRPAIALTFVLLFQQPPAPPAAGRIEGIVLRGDSMEPISGARVTVVRLNPITGQPLQTTATGAGGGLGGGNAPLPQPPGVALGAGGIQIPASPPEPGPPPQPPIPIVTTERDGKFVVPSLDEGVYRLTVTSNGYVAQEYGRRALSGPGTPLKLGKGDVLKDLVIRMTATGAISGRVTDGNGQPAAGVPLEMIRVAYNQNGQRSLQITTRATSNDRGEYRLYWITPGRYYLAGGTPLGESVPLPRDTYTLTYFPDTTDVDRAAAIEVKPGSENTYDLVVPRQPLYKIRGKIVDEALSVSPRALGLSVGFRTFGGGTGYLLFNQAYDPATGNFEIRDLPPGNYAVMVNTGSTTARVPVAIHNADIDGLVVVVSAGIAITGQVRADGGPLPPGTRIQLRPIVPGVSDFVGFAPQTQAAADGTFRFDGVLAAEYRAVITPPVDSYVKGAQFERNDVLNNSFEVSASRGAPPVLDIVVSSNVGQLDGMVVDERLQPVPGVQVVLVPDRNRDRAELFRSVTSDQSGRFSVRRIVPGDYRLFAWDALEANGYFDPELLKGSESQGKAVHFDESSKLEIQASVIPLRSGTANR